MTSLKERIAAANRLINFPYKEVDNMPLPTERELFEIITKQQEVIELQNHFILRASLLTEYFPSLEEERKNFLKEPSPFESGVMNKLKTKDILDNAFSIGKSAEIVLDKTKKLIGD